MRLRALVFLLRYSGLRIRDAVTLSRNRIQDDKLFLYTAKTGTAVYCPLPPFVVKALDAIPASTYFFWTGLSKPKSAVGDWRLNAFQFCWVIKVCALPRSIPHRGFGHGRSNWRPMSGALGRLMIMNRNKGYLAGTRESAHP